MKAQPYLGTFGRRIFAMVVVLGLSWFVGRPALGQWSYFAGVFSAYDGNPFSLYQAPASGVWTLEAGVDYAGVRMGAGYVGDYIRYDHSSTLDAYVHQVYLNVGDDTTSAGLWVERRFSLEDKIYDYTGVSVALVHRFGCPGMICFGQADVQLYRFAVMKDRDRQAVKTLIRSARSFPSGTTVIANLGAGYTRYAGDFSAYGQERAAVTQVSGGLRLAQALTAVTGVAVYVQERRIGGETPEALVLEEDGVSYAVLDDPALYGGRTFGVEITQMLFDYSLALKAGASHVRRSYLTQGSYLDATVYAVSVPREDTYETVWLQAEWDVWFGERSVALQLAAQWTDNRSSSFWYTYTGWYLSAGIRYHF
jgi:hypothetical protein